MMTVDGALQGLRVLDFSRVLAGPTCGMVLGDLGADVVKVERPGVGDETRGWRPPEVGGESAYYLCANRNKRGITLNLAMERGQAIAAALAAGSDVLIENFQSGWMAARGLGYPALRALNPRLIYASITGYGQTGPDAERPGYDFLIQGRSGLMSITGEADGPPMKVGVAVSDLFAGLYAAVAILAALQARATRGEGQWIDLALLDAQVASLANVASNSLVSGVVPQRYGNAHPNIVPYEAFPTAEGMLILAVGNDGQWRACCRVLERPGWGEEARFATNAARVLAREELSQLVAERLGARTAAEWEAAFKAAGVPAGRVNDVAKALADPQVGERGMVAEVPHPTAGNLRLVASPMRLSATPPSVRRPPPRLGEHTDEVLRERLGLAEAELAALRAAGIT
jgi:formyl-CoA transferase